MMEGGKHLHEQKSIPIALLEVSGFHQYSFLLFLPFSI